MDAEQVAQQIHQREVAALSTTLTTTGRRGRARRRPTRTARRFGYVVAIAVNAAMLYAVNRWPGWDAVPFLTARTQEVLPAVNASIIAGLIANVVFLVRDPTWLRPLGDVATACFGLNALTRLWVVFPVEFADGGVEWELVLRILLSLGIVGSIIGIVAALIRLGRALTGG